MNSEQHSALFIPHNFLGRIMIENIHTHIVRLLPVYLRCTICCDYHFSRKMKMTYKLDLEYLITNLRSRNSLIWPIMRPGTYDTPAIRQFFNHAKYRIRIHVVPATNGQNGNLDFVPIFTNGTLLPVVIINLMLQPFLCPRFGGFFQSILPSLFPIVPSVLFWVRWSVIME